MYVMYIMYVVGTHRGQKRESDPLENWSYRQLSCHVGGRN